MALTSEYDSPYAITGLPPALLHEIGTLSEPGSLFTAVTTSTPPYVSSGANPWYDKSVYLPLATGPLAQGLSWGAQPLLQAQPALPQGVAPGTAGSTAFYEQRLIATAGALTGTAYQHHHNPLWNPYANGFSSDPAASHHWPWSRVSFNTTCYLYTPKRQSDGTWKLDRSTLTNQYAAAYGQGTAGIDCSNLTSLVYNVAAGIYLDSVIGNQGVANEDGKFSGSSPPGWNDDPSAVFVDPNDPTSATITPIAPLFIFGPNSAYDSTRISRYITRFNQPGSLDSFISRFQPGDLLFIAGSPGSKGSITHVVMWLGEYGTMTDGSTSATPLVISSHDNTPAILDANGKMPPPGVAVLPFDCNSWFYQNMSHAMRVLPTPTDA